MNFVTATASKGAIGRGVLYGQRRENALVSQQQAPQKGSL
jgi:hypothetical protein